MHEVPQGLLYSPEHHWVRLLGAAGGGTSARWGLTAPARHHLGELVAATLPATGATLRRDRVYGEVEFTTTVADLFAPLDAVVSATNEALAASPELLDTDPYGEGWLLTVTTVAPWPGPGAGLLDDQAYRALVAAPDPRAEARARRRALQ